MKTKFVSASIHVDATGWIALEVPKDWTDEQIKEFAMESYFPCEGSNVEIGDPIEVVGVQSITAKQFKDAKGEGNAAIYAAE